VARVFRFLREKASGVGADGDGAPSLPFFRNRRRGSLFLRNWILQHKRWGHGRLGLVETGTSIGVAQNLLEANPQKTGLHPNQANAIPRVRLPHFSVGRRILWPNAGCH